MHGKIARILIFQKQHEFFSDVEVGTKIYDDFRHLMLKQQFSRKNRKSFSFFLSLCFFNRVSQISLSRLIRCIQIFFLFES